jgi:hypothetical protein
MSARERMERMGGERKWVQREEEIMMEDMEREKRRERGIKHLL